MRCCVIRQHERNSLFYRLDFLILAFRTVQFYERSWIERECSYTYVLNGLLLDYCLVPY